MNRMTTQDAIKIMQQYVDGETLESKYQGNDRWNINNQPVWDWQDHDYRIKSQSKYRPYQSKELLSLLGSYVILDGLGEVLTQYRITSVQHNLKESIVKVEHSMTGCYSYVSSATLLEKYQHVDGTPCGVLVSEEEQS